MKVLRDYWLRWTGPLNQLPDSAAYLRAQFFNALLLTSLLLLLLLQIPAVLLGWHQDGPGRLIVILLSLLLLGGVYLMGRRGQLQEAAWVLVLGASAAIFGTTLLRGGDGINTLYYLSIMLVFVCLFFSLWWGVGVALLYVALMLLLPLLLPELSSGELLSGPVMFIAFHTAFIVAIASYRDLLEQNLNEQRQRYQEEIHRIKDEMMSVVAHDLKNPIGAILGYAELLEHFSNEALVKSYTQKIQHSADEMNALVTNVLELAQMETGRQIRQQPEPIHHFLQEVLKGHELHAQQKQIKLCYDDPPPSELHLLLDRTRFAQVVNNLLSNAIKYTPEGGEVHLRGFLQGAEFWLQVQDNGWGIPPEAQPRLFEKFYRVQNPSHPKTEGTGLGLAIVKAIVEQHGGQIAVESALNVGTTITIRLPQAALPPQT